MEYRQDKYGNPISILGYGCMRFTQTAGRIDLQKAEKEILAAYQAGVNYYDTAYIYPGSEEALGTILSRNHIRDQVKIATKLPHYLLRKPEDLDKYFNEELRRLQTDHVDYYLMHMLTDLDAWEALKKLGAEAWLAEKKASGAIRQVGFSYHGNSEMFCKLVDTYDWDFCQIQYNYMDENSQAGRKGLLHAHEKGLPVVIMEPLRGGRLVNRLPAEAQKLFSDTPYSPAQWAFRWLWDQEEVTCVLSGMNSVEMVEENTATAAEARPGMLTEEDQAMLKKVVNAINSRMKVGCTGCGYCSPCPQKVDIPGTFSAYNRKYSEGKFAAWKDYLMCTALRKDSTGAGNCIGCGKCEKHCPQHIRIREELKNARRELETPAFRLARKVVRTFRHYDK